MSALDSLSQVMGELKKKLRYVLEHQVIYFLLSIAFF